MTKHPKHHKRKRAPDASGGSEKSAGHVRVIGGQWRGRKLPVVEVNGLRPTGDRVRETLFNWLQADIAGAHCLDLFAGSGALGFESLSRYASSVTFVEPEPRAQQALIAACQLLNVNTIKQAGRQNQSASEQASAHIVQGRAQATLQQWSAANECPLFDVVFIDPPFDLACQWSILGFLLPDHVADNALIYVESPRQQDAQLPASCELLREKQFGDVVARLLRYQRVDTGS